MLTKERDALRRGSEKLTASTDLLKEKDAIISQVLISSSPVSHGGCISVVAEIAIARAAADCLLAFLESSCACMVNRFGDSSCQMTDRPPWGRGNVNVSSIPYC